MSKIIVGLSTSIDGIASGTGEHDFTAVHEAVLGWLFNLRSWRAAQSLEGGEDTAESKLWGEEFERIGAQLTGRRMFDFSEPYWGDNPPFHAPVFVVTHRPAQRIEKQGGTAALSSAPLGPYQIQAAIAAVHSEAPDTVSTDWPQILGLYALLEQISPSPVVTLNRAVALAMVYGPEAGLRLLDGLDDDRKLASQHRLPALRGHLHEMAGDRDAARAAYLAAARRTTSLPEKRYLERKAAALSPA